MTKRKKTLATAPASGAIDLSDGVSDAEAALAGQALSARRATGSSSLEEPSGDSSSASPAAPEQLSAVAVSDTQIALAWQNNAIDAENIQVDRSTDGETDWETVCIVGAEVAEYLDERLTPGTAYAYRVTAFNEAGGACSDTAWATTETTVEPEPIETPAEPPVEPEPIEPDPVEPPVEPEPIAPPVEPPIEPPTSDRILIEQLEAISAANAVEIERLQTLKQVIYTGQRMAVLGDRIILEGETREVTQHELAIAEEAHPGEFQTVEAGGE